MQSTTDRTRTERQDAYAAALAAAMGFLSCPTDTTAARRWIRETRSRLRAYGYEPLPRDEYEKVLDAMEASGFLAHLRECRDGLVSEHFEVTPGGADTMSADLAADDADEDEHVFDA